MEIIKFKLLFIISSLVLVLLPMGAMANTVQPGQNFNDETGDEQNEGFETGNNDSQEGMEAGNNDQNRDDGPGSSGEEEAMTGQDDSNNENIYNEDGYNNNNYNNNGYNDFGNDYYNDENYNWTPEEEYTEPEYEEPVIEEPVIEEPVIEDPVPAEPAEFEEPEPEPEVNINTMDVENFLISGTVIDENNESLDGVELTLTGEDIEPKSIKSDDGGNFSFEDVPAGQFEIEVDVPEGYETEDERTAVEVSDRSKRGLEITLTAVEEESGEAAEPVETNEDIMAEETGGFSSMDWTLITTGIVFALISIFVFVFKKIRNN